MVFVGFGAGFEEIAVGEKTVFTGDGVFENGLLEREKGEGHIGAEEDKSADGREVGGPVGNGRKVDDDVKGELGKDDGAGEGEDVYGQDGLFTEAGVGIKDEGNDESENKETSEFGGEVVGVYAVEVAVDEAPEESGGDGDFDVFPGGLIDGGENAEGLGAF